MSKWILILAFGPMMASAQEVKVDGSIPAQEGTTTIQIKKSKGSEPNLEERTWEVTDGTVDINGETQTLTSEAKTAWKKACEEWKTEFRTDNKENKIISLNCGTPKCSGETAQKACSSLGTYKIKSKTK